MPNRCSFAPLTIDPSILSVIDDALREDIHTGDVTTEAIVDRGVRAFAEIVAKESGVIAGLGVAEAVFRRVDGEVDFTGMVQDSEAVGAGTVVAKIRGRARGILTAERVALNFLQRMSGIATKTAEIARLIEGTKVKILDTRKTTPGLRALEKYAVRAGGGFNHRMGLYDMILVKDNHIALAGGISRALESIRRRTPHTLKIEVETKTLDEVAEALRCGADIIMLDNMDLETMRRAVKLVDGRALLEASGGVNEGNVRAVAETGVDYISIGALTHSAKAMDLSLEVKGIEEG
ncbi:MAG: carboxylating nicotinate-nucleotide diphosphorylase [bacterium]